ncbi:DUF6504 family protein [Nocardioides deserti]|uniref:DUF6504 domain-containing protein n=1 Tax=Nocardioides deserti TaxID=1588644 RepID=A0ABR6U2Y6_9ACTN|nr:DUF6504 family protein [Nocardioides deserti]MBC2958768.1 hypothetical protein [Nocardioides deserti]GGO69714.1 hypothetical protein GCM10012276_06580 [Nocardioides deserti]
MVRYDDPVEVRTGAGGLEGPAQFLWRGRLWKVRTVLERRSQELPPREVWRVAAGRGRLDQDGPAGGGVFELVHDVPAGRWLLAAGAGAGAGE